MKNEMIGKYVKVTHGNLFDKYLIFGTVKNVDAFKSIYIQIDKLFAQTFFHYPRLVYWNPLFSRREVIYHDFRDTPKKWRYKKGDIIDFKLQYPDWRLCHDIKESSKKEAEQYTKEIDKLMKVKGGWFGFP